MKTLKSEMAAAAKEKSEMAAGRRHLAEPL
jgi:hypothetical protein